MYLRSGCICVGQLRSGCTVAIVDAVAVTVVEAAASAIAEVAGVLSFCVTGLRGGLSLVWWIRVRSPHANNYRVCGVGRCLR